MADLALHDVLGEGGAHHLGEEAGKVGRVVAEGLGDLRQRQPPVDVLVDVFQDVVVDALAAGVDLHPLAQAHQDLVELHADARPLVHRLVEYGGAHVHHVHEGAALVDGAAHIQDMGGELCGVAAAVLHPHQPQRVLGIGGVEVPLVGSQHEGLPGLHVVHVAATGDAAPPVDDAVDQAVAVGFVPGDDEVVGRLQHDPGPVDLHVQRVQVHGLGRDIVFIVGTGADDVVLQVVGIIIAFHGSNLAGEKGRKRHYIKIIQHNTKFVQYRKRKFDRNVAGIFVLECRFFGHNPGKCEKFWMRLCSTNSQAMRYDLCIMWAIP